MTIQVQPQSRNILELCSKLINNSESATKYLFWNSEAKEVSKEIMLEHIQQRKGKNLTYPHVIIPFCENSCPSNLIDLDIVTDGQVSNQMLQIWIIN